MAPKFIQIQISEHYIYGLTASGEVFRKSHVSDPYAEWVKFGP